MGENCPWIVQAGKESYEWEPIATLGDCLEDGPSRRSKAFQRIQADARLIAAAPELLEALEKASVRLETIRARLCRIGPNDGTLRAELVDYIRQCEAEADATLAKVTGAA